MTSFCLIADLFPDAEVSFVKCLIRLTSSQDHATMVTDVDGLFGVNIHRRGMCLNV